MKSFPLVLVLALLPLAVGAQPADRKQTQKPSPTRKNPKASPTPTPRDGSAEFEAAKAVTDALERLNALLKFAADFPESENLINAQELAVSARAEIAEAKLQAGDAEGGIALFRLAAEAAPVPVSDDLFSKVLLQFPSNLYARDHRNAAFEVAGIIEGKAAGSGAQLLALSTFFIKIEYASEAIRLASKAVETSPDLPLAHFTLGVAYRLGFRLEDSAASFAKASELDPSSIPSKRNLADLRRATGKAGEAVRLYREILEADPADKAARSGLALALLGSGEREEAEKVLEEALAADPLDTPLLASAALWYASNGGGSKAIEFGARARAADPKYPWAYIAEARGNIALKRPLEAERLLILARTAGNFPTLDYELAAARYSAGLYREAIETLGTNFSVEDGLVSTYLGNRVLADAETLQQLLSLERKASILMPELAQDAEAASGLKSLLELVKAIGASGKPDEAAAIAASRRFASGDDNMRAHRQLFAASRLLQNNIGTDAALELTKEAVTGLDASLDVAAPAAAVLADELYEGRVSAASRGEMVIVPDLGKQTLSGIVRGRIEELAGWAFLQKKDPAQAISRIRRGLTVLPEKSIWWRSSQWRLGNAFEAEGRPKDALEAYIRAFNQDYPDVPKYRYIRDLYAQVNGNLDGFESRVGRDPEVAVTDPAPRPRPTVTAQDPRIPSVVPIAPPTAAPPIAAAAASETSRPSEDVPEVKRDETPTPSPEPATEPTPSPVTEEKKEEPKAEPDPTPKSESKPEATPSPVTEEKKEEPKAEPVPTPNSESKPEPTPSPVTEEKREEPKAEPIREPAPTPSAEPAAEPVPSTAEDMPAPTPKSNPTPVAAREKSEPKPLFEPIIITVPSRPSADDTRGRVTGKEPEPKPCTVIPTRDSVSIFANGGLWGLLVDVRDGNPADLRASSDSPENVSVTSERGPEGETVRRFFVIRSVSARTGDFKVTFSADCGSSSVSVNVRDL